MLLKEDRKGNMSPLWRTQSQTENNISSALVAGNDSFCVKNVWVGHPNTCCYPYICLTLDIVVTYSALKVHLDLLSCLRDELNVLLSRSLLLYVSWVRCRVGTASESMTGNGNVTGSHAPVTVASTGPGQWSIQETGGLFGPLTPNKPIWSPLSPHTEPVWPDQPPDSSFLPAHCQTAM